MSKRSQFAPRPKDFWRTPAEALAPLLPQLPAGTLFAEPCAGDGALVDLLTAAGHKCVWATDTAPARDDVRLADALTLRDISADMFVTNPPWTRTILHPLIDHLSSMLPTWLLFDADWGFTKQSAGLIHRCSKIVPIGRIKWIPDSKYSGMDSCAWYEFLPGHTIGPRFVGYQEAASALRAVRAPRQAPAVATAPTPAPAPPDHLATDLLARLRGKLRPMANIPRLGPEQVG